MTHHYSPLDEEYSRKIEVLADEQGLERDRVAEAFRDHYRTFDETTTEETPPEVLRRLAYHKLQWDPPDGGDGESAGTE